MDVPQTAVMVTPDAIARKKRFWLWNLIVSAILMAAIPLLALLSAVAGTRRASPQLGKSGADVAALGEHVGEVLVATAIGSSLALIALIWLIVAIVRFCMIPKPAGAMP